MTKTKKINKITVGFIAVLLIASLATLASAQDSPTIGISPTISGGSPTDNSTQAVATYQQNKTEIVPGAPENAYTYNKTDVIPKNQMEQVKAGEPTIFQYRNMTMLMNCTGNCNVIFSGNSEVTPKILGISIEHDQNMTLTMNMYNSPLEGQKVAERTLNFYLGIEPSAQQQLKGQIRLYINQTELNSELEREVNASKLTWMFYNTTAAKWQAVPSFIDANGYLVCNTDHFSTWTVAELVQTDAENPTQTNLNVNYFIASIFAITIIVGITVSITLFKRRK